MTRKSTSSGEVLTTTGLAMPDDFPTGPYQSIHLKLAAHAKISNAGYMQFAGAWSAVSYRYFAFAEYDQFFSRSISMYGAGPPAEERYRQERDLFGFFNSGYSTFEAFFYGAFAAGALVDQKQFPIATPQDQRRITAANTVMAFRAAFAPDPIVGELEAVTKTAVYVEMRDVRNVLSHRSAPGRTMHIALGDQPAPDQWKLANIVLDQSTTTVRREQASIVLTAVMGAFQRFCSSHF